MTPGTTYQPSGAIPPARAIRALVLLPLAALVYGVAYGLLTRYMPFIYLSIIATFCLGLLVGETVLRVGLSGKIRNRLYPIVGGLLLAAGAWYVSWVVYAAVFYQDHPVLILPRDLFAAMVDMANIGTFTLEGMTPPPFLFFMLWIFEALIIVGVGVVRSWYSRPFCEACDAWFVNRGAVQVYRSTDPGALRSALLAGDTEALLSLPPAGEEDREAIEVQLWSCPDDAHASLITASELQLETVTPTKTKVHRVPVVKLLCVSDEVARRLRNPPQQAPSMAPTPGSPTP